MQTSFQDSRCANCKALGPQVPGLPSLVFPLWEVPVSIWHRLAENSACDRDLHGRERPGEQDRSGGDLVGNTRAIRKNSAASKGR
jgi:hypothetical protein